MYSYLLSNSDKKKVAQITWELVVVRERFSFFHHVTGYMVFDAGVAVGCCVTRLAYVSYLPHIMLYLIYLQ